ncbi:hypothetical protein [Erwinia billingiae]|uniref:hypothetical protein n=1 Tax=Erwinia billingiae TaxID=182337 RepID=UPI0019CFA1C0|nr:hypothetical protein [Erwinia billingiae]
MPLIAHLSKPGREFFNSTRPAVMTKHLTSWLATYERRNGSGYSPVLALQIRNSCIQIHRALYNSVLLMSLFHSGTYLKKVKQLRDEINASLQKKAFVKENDRAVQD